ncbi:MAG TPA: FAD-dependent thymidylate synthase [Nitrospinota bacterium]|jgi:thymidylate synthase (FAD)|nr:FAD-dependent thymidylate synthase [Nitrospinota bacterium]
MPDLHPIKVELLSITAGAEKLLEEAGRTCYLSFERTSEESYKKFIRMIVRSGHHSVLEHASATFRIKGGSRSFTHQLVRHRLCAYSQQSQRYVNEKNFSIVIPDSIKNNSEAKEAFLSLINDAQDTYVKLQKIGVKKEDARFVLPNAIESEIVMTANFRELRHIFKERCHKAAQWEIRRIAIEMLKIMRKEAPIVFEDFIINEEKDTAETA